MDHIVIKAGKGARKIIAERGIRPQDIKIVTAAASGPKWIILYALDKFIFGDWLMGNNDLHLIGASAGAWRMCCAAQDEPVQALDQLAKYYIEQSYPEMPTPQEVTTSCQSILMNVFGNLGISQILKSQERYLHILSNRSHFEKWENVNLLKLTLAGCFAKNALNRKGLNRYFDRVVFTNSKESVADWERDPIHTEVHKMNEDFIVDAATSSGCIPTWMAPVADIGPSKGLHWDGGLVDYHIDVPFEAKDQLVLTPHYNDHITTGWMDQFLPWRKKNPTNKDQVVLISPSQKFIDLLPNKQIPDRNDFLTYFQKDDERIDNWYKALELSKLIREDFESWLGMSDPNTIISDL